MSGEFSVRKSFATSLHCWKTALLGLATPALLLLLFATGARGQSSSSGLVNGTVRDPSGAVVPGASIKLINKATNVSQTTKADTAGQFVFPSVDPGDYQLEISMTGFRTTRIGQVHVEVLKSNTADVKLEVGQMTETVQVAANPGAELQTTSATVGQTLETTGLEDLPTYTRTASSLMFLQPAVTPISQTNNGVDDTRGGQVSGARADQITFNLDGGDVTSDLEGTMGLISPPREPQPEPVVPIPIESTQEFRVATSNPNALFSHSSGGDVAIITKSGTNDFHGSAYEYHDDDALDANSWTNNFSRIHKPHSVDNRFGSTLGGPAWRKRLWFFGSFEGHQFNDNATLTRLVPTSTLKSGIIEFPDGQGQVESYPLQPGNISTACSGGPCDPRNIGMSPAIQKQLALYPAGNNPSIGDGFNTTGFTFNTPTPVSAKIGVLRLDGKINDRWSVFATYHTGQENIVSTNQVDIVSSVPETLSSNPIQSNYFTLQVTGEVTPHLTVVTHGSFLRNWWSLDRVPGTPLVSGLGQALELAGEGVGSSNATTKLLADPINIDTQDARFQEWNGHDWYVAQDWSWIKGHHLFQFGASGFIWDDRHVRGDDIEGGLANFPIDYIEAVGNGSGAYATVPSSDAPPTCGGSLQTGCIPSSDLLRWNELYASLLGIVDRSAQIETRNGMFQPNPLGTYLQDNATLPSFYTYFQDVYQVSPSVTFTFGLNWGAQLTPSEAEGKFVVLTYAGSNSPIDFWGYLQNRAASLNAGVLPGQAYNPLFALSPVNSLPDPLQGKLRTTAWGDFAPRASVAWNVPYENRVFGHHQTVIRAGYAILYDRENAADQVQSPLITGGVADVDSCAGPISNGSGGVTCTKAATNPSNAFRIGVDGNSVPVPAPTAVPIPDVPSGSAAAPYGIYFSNPLDPWRTPGHSHAVDLNVQRELPGKMLIEIGYIGRFSRNISQGEQLNAADYLMKDAASGQTYAQAFDAVAQALRTHATVPVEPFFENQIGTATCTAKGFSSCSAMVAKQDPTDLINGNLYSFSQDEFDLETPTPVDNLQFFELAGLTDRGWSNYNAGYISLNKSLATSLQLGFNWTWSHAIGDHGNNQDLGTSGASTSPFNPSLGYSSEIFDRRHVINTWWRYQLPFGTGGRFLAHRAVVDRIVGGWVVSGIFTFATGTPICVSADGNYGASLGGGTCAIPITGTSLSGLGGSVNSGVLGSQGIGTSTTGQNLFANPAVVYDSLSRPLLSVNGSVPYDELRNPWIWNVDFSISKNIVSTERVKVLFSTDFFNLFNHAEFTAPSLDLNSPSTFGVFSAQSNLPRQIQLGLRVVF